MKFFQLFSRPSAPAFLNKGWIDLAEIDQHIAIAHSLSCLSTYMLLTDTYRTARRKTVYSRLHKIGIKIFSPQRTAVTLLLFLYWCPKLGGPESSFELEISQTNTQEVRQLIYYDCFRSLSTSVSAHISVKKGDGNIVRSSCRTHFKHISIRLQLILRWNEMLEIPKK